MKAVCSFGVGAGPHACEASLDDLLSAIYMAGDLDVERREVEGRPVWTALARNEWRFATTEFADLVQRIVGIERAFFDDFDRPFYLVTLIPIGKGPGRAAAPWVERGSRTRFRSPCCPTPSSAAR